MKRSYTKLDKKFSSTINLGDIVKFQHDMQDFIEKNVRVADPPLYWFREHRGSLEGSLKTVICCHCGLNSIVEYFKHMSHPNPCPYTGIHIQPNPIIDERLPIWWGEIEYAVMGFSNEGGHNHIVTLGYCNFK